MPHFSFDITHRSGAARRGRFVTPHGTVETPAFMPVGTHGVVRGISMPEVAAAGAQMVLANAYHLYLRPGDETVRSFGGLHEFTRWRGPMLTDSGGFQVFSLASLRTVSDDGIEFRSHLDGSLHRYTPESVMRIQRNIGADVIMQLDELIAAGADLATSRAAMERSLRWLARCRATFDSLDDTDEGVPPQALFPIVQGGTHAALRRASVDGILGSGDWVGIAVGGLSVGEAKPDMHAALEACDPVLPTDKPRYLMGVGHPDDLLEGVRRGVDLFDCVAPTRMGRHGTAFTPDGTVQVGGSHRTDRRPLLDGCPCPACTEYDRAYLRHLFVAREDLGKRLLSLHNVTFLLSLMSEVRARIADGSFASWSVEWLERYAMRSASTAS